MTYFVVFFDYFAVCYLEWVGSSEPRYGLISFFTLIVFLIVWSHLQATLADPGYIPLNYKKLNSRQLPHNVLLYFNKELSKSLNQIDSCDFASIQIPQSDAKEGKPTWRDDKAKLIKQITRQCYECDSIKPPKTHHCNECGRYRGNEIILDALHEWIIIVPGLIIV